MMGRRAMDYDTVTPRHAEPPRPAGTCPVPGCGQRYDDASPIRSIAEGWEQDCQCRRGHKWTEAYRHDPDAVRVVSGVDDA